VRSTPAGLLLSRPLLLSKYQKKQKTIPDERMVFVGENDFRLERNVAVTPVIGWCRRRDGLIRGGRSISIRFVKVDDGDFANQHIWHAVACLSLLLVPIRADRTFEKDPRSLLEVTRNEISSATKRDRIHEVSVLSSFCPLGAVGARNCHREFRNSLATVCGRNFYVRCKATKCMEIHKIPPSILPANSAGYSIFAQTYRRISQSYFTTPYKNIKLFLWSIKKILSENKSDKITKT